MRGEPEQFDTTPEMRRTCSQPQCKCLFLFAVCCVIVWLVGMLALNACHMSDTSQRNLEVVQRPVETTQDLTETARDSAEAVRGPIETTENSAETVQGLDAGHPTERKPQRDEGTQTEPTLPEALQRKTCRLQAPPIALGRRDRTWIRLQNIGTRPCRLHVGFKPFDNNVAKVSFSATIQPSFSLSPKQTQLIMVKVDYARTGWCHGDIEFTQVGDTAPTLRLELKGDSGSDFAYTYHIDSNKLRFGDVKPSSSRKQAFTLHYSGWVQDELLKVYIDGPTHSQQAFALQTMPSLPTTLATGRKYRFTVIFSPKKDGNYPATIRFKRRYGEAFRLDLLGTTQPSCFQSTHTTLDFGTVQVGCYHPKMSVQWQVSGAPHCPARMQVKKVQCEPNPCAPIDPKSPFLFLRAPGLPSTFTRTRAKRADLTFFPKTQGAFSTNFALTTGEPGHEIAIVRLQGKAVGTAQQHDRFRLKPPTKAQRYRLSRVPRPMTIVVRDDAKRLIPQSHTKGWQYRAQDNHITLHGIPTTLRQISVAYSATCLSTP